MARDGYIMTNNLTIISEEVTALDSQALILEVVTALGWEISENGMRATSHAGTILMLSTAGVLGRSFMDTVSDLTSDKVQWRVLREVIEGLWFNEPLAAQFMELLEMGCVNRMDKYKLGRMATTMTAEQFCRHIVIAHRMRG